MYTASVIFAEGILILRTYALWGRNKRVLFFLLFLAGVSPVRILVRIIQVLVVDFLHISRHSLQGPR